MITPRRDRLRLLALTTVARMLTAPRPERPPERLLLIRPDHFGDLLLASAAVAALRRALPRAHLTLMVGPWSAEAARRGPEVDEILTCEFPGFTRRRKPSSLQPYRLLWAEAGRLRGRYDLAVVLRPDHWWGALLAAAARIPHRVGYALTATRPLLTDMVPIPAATHAVALNLMLVSRAAELAGSSAISGSVEALADRGSGPSFSLTDDERAWASALVDDARKPVVLLHPGSGSALKSWPAERWAGLADAVSRSGFCVALSGGTDDLAGPREVAEAMREAPLLLAGKTSLGQLGAVLERCALAVGCDNGPLHLAAALGTPTLRLYGPTDERLFGPWPPSENHSVVKTQLPCRPCGELIAPPCGARRVPPCMLGIGTDLAIGATLAQLRAVAPGSPAAV